MFPFMNCAIFNAIGQYIFLTSRSKSLPYYNYKLKRGGVLNPQHPKVEGEDICRLN